MSELRGDQDAIWLVTEKPYSWTMRSLKPERRENFSPGSWNSGPVFTVHSLQFGHRLVIFTVNYAQELSGAERYLWRIMEWQEFQFSESELSCSVSLRSIPGSLQPGAPGAMFSELNHRDICKTPEETSQALTPIEKNQTMSDMKAGNFRKLSFSPQQCCTPYIETHSLTFRKMQPSPNTCPDLVLVFIFETGFHCVTLAVLKLTL